MGSGGAPDPALKCRNCPARAGFRGGDVPGMYWAVRASGDRASRKACTRWFIQLRKSAGSSAIDGLRASHNRRPSPSPASLPPRPKIPVETIAGLVAGQAKTEIAKPLGIVRHTVLRWGRRRPRRSYPRRSRLHMLARLHQQPFHRGGHRRVDGALACDSSDVDRYQTAPWTRSGWPRRSRKLSRPASASRRRWRRTGTPPS